MPVYTVHGPRTENMALRSTSDRIVFVRDGFHFWAFVFGLLWLAYHRLWLAALGYLVFTVALTIAMAWLGLSSDVRFVVMFLVALLMGFEGASLWRWTLSRRNWRQLDIVAADNREVAEQRFFDRWIAGQRRTNFDMTDRGAPPPAREPARPLGAHTDIIGLFPQPGPLR